jgi:ubiquinone/menaquinone biosynthesis C-methylase UbiE
MANDSEGHSDHNHTGLSSEGLMDAEYVLYKIGLKKGQQFLDAGSGDGFFTIPAARMVGPEGKVYAIDVWEDGIALLRQKLSKKRITNVVAMVADLTRHIPLEEDSIDFCLLSNILHGFVANKEVDKVFRELTRVIKTGGVLAVLEFKKIETPGPPLKIRLSAGDVERVVDLYGFKRESSIDIGPYNYIILLKKI